MDGVRPDEEARPEAEPTDAAGNDDGEGQSSLGDF